MKKDCASGNLYRYDGIREMVPSCAPSIQLIDGGFWVVFSENDEGIGRLEQKFLAVKHVTLDDLPD